jgi:DeoR family transcriptional regulator of aga operon
MSLKTDKRAKEIVRLLLHHGKASVDDLTSALATSPASIRRDLIRLEENGLVHRTHGGAMLARDGGATYEPFRFDASFQVREDRFAAEKQRIARAAAALVQEDETIGFAAGTTTTLVARQLLHRKNIHIITNAGWNLAPVLVCRPRLPAETCVGPAHFHWLARRLSSPWPW